LAESCHQDNPAWRASRMNYFTKVVGYPVLGWRTSLGSVA